MGWPGQRPADPNQQTLVGWTPALLQVGRKTRRWSPSRSHRDSERPERALQLVGTDSRSKSGRLSVPEATDSLPTQEVFRLPPRWCTISDKLP